MIESRCLTIPAVRSTKTELSLSGCSGADQALKGQVGGGDKLWTIVERARVEWTQITNGLPTPPSRERVKMCSANQKKINRAAPPGLMVTRGTTAGWWGLGIMRHSQPFQVFFVSWFIRRNRTSLYLKAETQLDQWSLIWLCRYQWLVCSASLQYTQSTGLRWIKANEAWGSLLTNSEPWRSHHALSGGLHPNLQDRGNFPIEMRSRCLSQRPRFGLLSSFSQTWPATPPRGKGKNMSTMGRVAVPELNHMMKECFLWETLALGTALWAHGAGPRAPNFLMEKCKQDLIETSCSGDSHSNMDKCWLAGWTYFGFTILFLVLM